MEAVFVAAATHKTTWNILQALGARVLQELPIADAATICLLVSAWWVSCIPVPILTVVFLGKNYAFCNISKHFLESQSFLNSSFHFL